MGIKENIRALHLQHYLQDEFGVEIIKKYGVYIILASDKKIVDFFYSLREVKEFLESKEDFIQVRLKNGLPVELINKKDAELDEPSEEEAETSEAESEEKEEK